MNAAQNNSHAQQNAVNRTTPADHIPASPATEKVAGVITPVGAAKHDEATDKAPLANTNTPAVKPSDKKAAEGKQKEFKAGKYILRASPKHPNRRFRIGNHEVGAQFEMFVLNEAEAKELGTEGPQKWLEIGNEAKLKADKEAFKDFKDLDKEPL